ncbi:unnamed protein product [Rotaria sp. Silwood1]|nr:unnamed protein product [Rotaria sp. Silwood1]
MSYSNKTYVAFDADNDIHYYRLMLAWKQSDRHSFSFYNAHDINNLMAFSSEETIKAKLRESIIIPINNKFKVNPGGHLGTSPSMLAQFVRDFYDNKPDNLQYEIDKELQLEKYSDIKISSDTYKIGSVICLKAKGRQFYLLANAVLNVQHRSQVTKELLEQSLNELWIFLSEHAGKEKFILPVLGTGRGRITMTREEVIKEIVLSFIASCSEKNYADKLIISIHPKDITEHGLNLGEIVKWTEAKVNYADFQKRIYNNKPGTTALGS